MKRWRSPYRRRQQRGAMSLTLMLVMAGMVAMLGLVEIGYLYWAKRDAQSVADLAALAGAQRLDLCAPDNADNAAARSNARQQNGFSAGLEIACGSWHPDHAAQTRFSTSVDAAYPRNAVRVIARRPVLPFFSQNSALPSVAAQAVAIRSEPMAAFSVGSQLLRINGNSSLGNTLRLVGVDLDQTTVLGYDGLAQVRATPAGLLDALGIEVDAQMGVGEFNALLAARRISVGQLLRASSRLISRQGVAGLDLDLLADALSAQLDLDALSIPLGSSDTSPGLFARIIAPDGGTASALRSELNLMDLLTTSIAIAGQQRAVQVEQLDLLGLVSAQAAVVEPPSIAIGGVGAQAYNAQVRLFVNIDSQGIPLLGSVLSTLGIRLNLPLHADVTNAMGTVQSLQCGAAPPTATVEVRSSVLRACVGQVQASDRFSRRNVCDASLADERLLTLFGAPLLEDSIRLNALESVQTLTLAAGETASTRVNPLQLGSAVAGLVQSLLDVLSGMLNPRPAGMSAEQTAHRLAERYVQAAHPGGGRYRVDDIIPLLANGDASIGLQPLGNWDLQGGKVWDYYRATVTGQGQGLLGNLLGGLLGGLLVNRCDALLVALNTATYNACVRDNLAAYIQTAPDGLLDAMLGDGVSAPGSSSVPCSGILCTLLQGPLQVLKPVLNAVGTLLTDALAQVLGIELGRTDVHMQSVQCSAAQLVY